MDISKIEAGKLSVIIDKVDLQQIVNEVVDIHLASIQNKKLALNLPDWQQKLYVLADAAKLKQVLINVVSNAVKFTDYGNISLDITIQSNFGDDYQYLLAPTKEYQLEENISRSQEELPDMISNYKTKNHPQQVVITIEDTGIGIAESEQQKLFNPFVMVDGSTTRKFGGTGLGLAISRNLIELMSGSISLSSEGEGKGTIVQISLPLGEILSLSNMTEENMSCLLYTSPSPRDLSTSRMPSSA